MGDVAKAIFGGGGKDDSAARKAAEQSRREQKVANDRQLNEANRQEKKTSVRRRGARGRRLFEDGAGGLASTLGE